MHVFLFLNERKYIKMQANDGLMQSLEKVVANNDEVFIVTHIRPDFDALGSVNGICKLFEDRFKKNCYIVIDDDLNRLPDKIKETIFSIAKSKSVISLSDVPKLISRKSLLVCTDTNKDYLVSINSFLKFFNDILVIDHHNLDEHSIKTSYTFTDVTATSASEIIACLLFYYGVQISESDANLLLAGIYLDTNKFSKNINVRVLKIIEWLKTIGANIKFVESLFEISDYHKKMIETLISGSEIYNGNFAIATSNDENLIYTVEEIAISADYLASCGVASSFVIAHVSSDVVAISARSNGMLDVSQIMQKLGGGGSPTAAATRIKNMDISEIKQRLKDTLHSALLIDTKEDYSRSLLAVSS